MPDKTSAIYAEAFRLEGEVARLQSALAAATARADAAIAEIVNEQRRFGEMQREAWKLDAALAAARRECDLLRAALVEVRDNHVAAGMDVRCYRCAVKMPCPTRRIADDALASPAAGEEGKR